ncbi:MAG: hypothetical protein OXF79_00630 [Chloroflexi bacterium]|nr:hypothetical protein [Chloroflexota bacterium]
MAPDRIKAGEKVALAQDHQLKTLQGHMGKLEEHTSDLQAEASDHADALSDLHAGISALLSDAGLTRPSNNELEEVQIADQLQLSEFEAMAIRQSMPDLSLAIVVPDGAAGWDSYLHEVDQYIEKYSIDLTRDPLEQLLPPHRAAEIYREFQADFGPSPWDRWDYGIVAATVLAGALLDYFIVATPLGKDFKGQAQRVSPLTSWMRDKSDSPFIKKVTKWAEAKAKVPYDKVDPSNSSLHPTVHRLSSLGHDPIFGLLFGTIDILRNKCTYVDGQSRLQVVGNGDTAVSALEIPNAIVKVILHYLSDAFTSTGLPAPFLAQIQRIQADSGFTLEKGGNTVSVNELTRHMYRNGYDLRHFLTMAIVPAFAELVIRTYHAVRVSNEDVDVGKEGIRGKLKLAKILLVTHALLSSTNILKTALYRWDPTALNLAQFLALAKQMLCLLKLSHERNNLVAKELEDGYKELLRGYDRKL